MMLRISSLHVWCDFRTVVDYLVVFFAVVVVIVGVALGDHGVFRSNTILRSTWRRCMITMPLVCTIAAVASAPTPRGMARSTGCVACSTWVPMNKDYPAALGSGAKDIPVAQFHGTRDEVVLLTWGQRR